VSNVTWARYEGKLRVPRSVLDNQAVKYEAGAERRLFARLVSSYPKMMGGVFPPRAAASIDLDMETTIKAN